MSYMVKPVPIDAERLQKALNDAERGGWTLIQLIWAEPVLTAVFHSDGSSRGRRRPPKPEKPPGTVS